MVVKGKAREMARHVVIGEEETTPARVVAAPEIAPPRSVPLGLFPSEVSVALPPASVVGSATLPGIDPAAVRTAVASYNPLRIPATHPLFAAFDPREDPRPDLAGDSGAWGRLLTLAAAIDADAAAGLTAGLHAIRCLGARLVAVEDTDGRPGGARIVPGELSVEEYTAARDRLLVPHRRVLVGLLGKVVMQEIVIQERKGALSTL